MASLIGQWLPVNVDQASVALQPFACQLLQQLVRLFLCHAYGRLRAATPSAVTELLTGMSELLSASPQSWLGADQLSQGGLAPHASALDMASMGRIQWLMVRLVEMLEKLHLQLPTAGQALLTSVRSQLDALESQAARLGHQEGMSFVWVDSPLVAAVKAGHWVLLENINTAPPEVSHWVGEEGCLVF